MHTESDHDPEASLSFAVVLVGLFTNRFLVRSHVDTVLGTYRI